jgi:hypothetical protein
MFVKVTAPGDRPWLDLISGCVDSGADVHVLGGEMKG